MATPEVACLRAARLVAREIRAKPDAALALAAGGTPRGIYAELVRQHRAEGLSFARLSAFNLDEYVGVSPEHPRSFRRALQEELYQHVDLPAGRTYAPDGMAADPAEACRRYEDQIAAVGGFDLALLGLGRDGHIAFNEPTSSLASRTRIKTLTEETRASCQPAFQPEPAPRHALTIGIATILSARRIVLVAFGSAKADAVARTVEGPLTAMVPGSALQLHPRAIVIVDEAAASGLTLRAYYDTVAAAKPAWQRED